MTGDRKSVNNVTNKFLWPRGLRFFKAINQNKKYEINFSDQFLLSINRKSNTGFLNNLILLHNCSYKFFCYNNLRIKTTLVFYSHKNVDAINNTYIWLNV